MQCWKCKKVIDVKEKVGRRAICPHCSNYLHCCYNCRFFDENAHHQCREPQAEYVADKTFGNFCDYFEPAGEGVSGEKKTSKEDAQKLWKKYFKKS